MQIKFQKLHFSHFFPSPFFFSLKFLHDPQPQPQPSTRFGPNADYVSVTTFFIPQNKREEEEKEETDRKEEEEIEEEEEKEKEE